MNRLKFVLIAILFAMLVSSVNAQGNDEGTLSIPALDLHTTIGFAPFEEGGTWDVSHLRMQVARLEALPWFSTEMNMVLVGHSLDSTGKPDIFYRLKDMQIGDIIYVNTGGKRYLYRVVEVTNVDQTDLSILYPSNGADLTLFTCDADSFISGTYQRREVVIAQHVRPLRFGAKYTPIVTQQTIANISDNSPPIEIENADLESKLHEE